MLDYQEKRNIKRFVYSRPVIGFLLILISKGVWNAYSESKLTSDNRNSAEQEFNDLLSRKDVIQKQIADLSTFEGKEREVRSKFQVAKEGEQMVMIVDEKKDYVQPEEEKSIFLKIKDFFSF